MVIFLSFNRQTQKVFFQERRTIACHSTGIA
jgi:hypothetical protein